MDFMRNPVAPSAGNAANPGALPYVKSIPCSNYTIGDDYDVWRVHYKDNVRAVFNLDTQDARLNDLYLRWISTRLSPGPTRAVYGNLDDADKASWDVLDQALSDAFVDQKDKLDFLSRLNAHRRTPGMSLRTYKDMLLQKMDKYQKELRRVPGEWQRTVLQRFREGLENPALAANLMMNCSGPGATLDQAFNVATNWENTMSHMGQQVTNGAANPLLTAMMGGPIMAAVQMAPNGQAPITQHIPVQSYACPSTDRLSRIEIKLKEHDLSIAEVKAGQLQLQSEVQAIRTDITQNFASLRKDLGLVQGQPTAPRAQQSYQPAHQQSYQQPNHNQPRPQIYGQPRQSNE